MCDCSQCCLNRHACICINKSSQDRLEKEQRLSQRRGTMGVFTVSVFTFRYFPSYLSYAAALSPEDRGKDSGRGRRGAHALTLCRCSSQASSARVFSRRRSSAAWCCARSSSSRRLCSSIWSVQWLNCGGVTLRGLVWLHYGGADDRAVSPPLRLQPAWRPASPSGSSTQPREEAAASREPSRTGCLILRHVTPPFPGQGTTPPPD